MLILLSFFQHLLLLRRSKYAIQLGDMMKRVLLALALTCSSAIAGTLDPADVISQQSGLPASEVQAMLANCDENQMSLNFCAWRDRVVAEQKLQDAIDDKTSNSPDCKARLEKKITAWKKRRDASCKKSAEAENGGGSIVPMEIAACQAAETDRMTKVVASIRRCN
ncbi:DUF1311 domain-containing protein [Paraburkholderia sediminicola]|uniref:DUF1311 domain-containing protein n=1 Tax=Paraburkholderia metrosideri TaxID=580937 RepID=A0ABW9DWK6_9BURK